MQGPMFWALPQNSKYRYLDFLPWLQGFQNGMSHNCRTKTQGGDRFSRKRLFLAQGRNPVGRLIWFSSPKITCEELDWSRKFHTDPFIPSKVIQLFNLDRQTHRLTDTPTDRQTDTWTPHPYTGRQDFLCLFLIPFTSLRLLHSLCSWRIIVSV
jgi:hypothetical protein